MNKSTSIKQPEQQRRFYGLSEISHDCGLSLSTLKNLRKAGHLPEPCRVGRRTLWTAEQVDTLAAKIVAGDLKDASFPISNNIQKQ
jgi:predicted DNA-binding transcriptional regulator AlpA